MSPSPQSTPPVTVAVLGAGTWGITLADILAQNGHRVRCWDIDAGLIDLLGRERRHPKLTDFVIDPAVSLTADLRAAFAEATVCVLVVPSKAMRSALSTLKEVGLAAQIQGWVLCTKGIEPGSLMLMHEVLADVLGAEAGARAGVLSGPSHAEEVSRRLPTTVVASSADPALAEAIQRWFFRPWLRVYTVGDMAGVELGGSLKNVIAIAAGLSDGMGFGDNTRAALMTRGLAEIVRLGLAAGARLETFMGLSGIGDLIVTAGSGLSRNHNFGRLLAEGLSCEDALKKVGMVVEGYTTAESAWQLARKYKVDMPITEVVHRILYEGLSPRQGVEELLARDPKPERY